MRKYAVSQTPPYENWKVLNIDGELMFRCAAKRANWYLSRNLAEQKDSETIQLKFKTKGEGHVGDEFYLQTKHNQCVVCGCEELLTRHHIVPRCYRRFFPVTHKSKSSYDVMLLCVDCHHKYEMAADQLKSQISREHGVSIQIDKVMDEEQQKQYEKFVELSRIKKNAGTLTSYEDRLPESRKEELLKSLEVYLNKYPTKEDIKSLANMELMSISGKEFHGEYVVSKLTSIEDFIIRWREHFLKTMKPRFLPKAYNVNRITVPKG